MTFNTKHQTPVSSISRRKFVQGSVLATAGFATLPSISPFQFSQGRSNFENQDAQVFIFQDKAHFYKNDLLKPYIAPKSLASSTRKYVNSLDPQTFLSRHWFV